MPRYVIRHPDGERFRAFSGWTPDADMALNFPTSESAADFLNNKIGEVVPAPTRDEQFASRASAGALPAHDPFGLRRG